MECFRLGRGHITHHTGERIPVAERQNQVVVRIAAAGVCYRDLIDQRGGYPNQRLGCITGHEFAGVVVSPGPMQGKRVAAMHSLFGIVEDGGYATHCVCDADALVPVPDGVSLVQASFLFCTAAVALRALRHHARLREGETALVTGATGGVGIHALQLARLLGARVYGQTRTAQRAALIAPFCDGVVLTGAAHTQRYDVIIECVGSPTFPAALKALAPGGRIVVVGNVNMDPAPLPFGKMIAYEASVTGSRGATREDLLDVFQWVCDGRLKPIVHATFPLRDAVEAQRHIHEAVGRVVLLCDDSRPAAKL